MTYETSVSSLLIANLDGPGIVDSFGQHRRSFYWEIVEAPRLPRPRRARARRRPPPRPRLPDLVLTPRQFAVAELFVAGLTLDGIAEHLSISRSTTEVHLRGARERYRASGRNVSTKEALGAEFRRETPAIAFRGRLVSPARAADRFDTS